jgi:hypothetical protein
VEGEVTGASRGGGTGRLAGLCAFPIEVDGCLPFLLLLVPVPFVIV